jgi:zinc D-Ala-D-Ala dipeptidase
MQDFSQIIQDALAQPIPIMDDMRKRKKGYSELPIDTFHPQFNEPLVDIADYGLAGQPYYSRPNAATGDPVDGVPKIMYLRKTVAETLSKINTTLQNPVFTEFFRGEVELYVQDALRPISLQKKLHDELIPTLLRTQHPGISDEAVAERIQDLIAVPSSDPRRPSPHATGGALDVILRYKQPTREYVADSQVFMGHCDADTGDRILPDYFEQHEPQTDDDRHAQCNRRAYYAIMTGAAFGVDTGLVCNPTEWWHWGSGDQLAAKVRGDAAAYYSVAVPNEAAQN